MKINLLYLFKYSWFLIIFTGLLGYIIFENSTSFWDYPPSRIIVSVMFPASVMYAGLVVGYHLGCTKKK